MSQVIYLMSGGRFLLFVNNFANDDPTLAPSSLRKSSTEPSSGRRFSSTPSDQFDVLDHNTFQDHAQFSQRSRKVLGKYRTGMIAGFDIEPSRFETGKGHLLLTDTIDEL